MKSEPWTFNEIDYKLLLKYFEVIWRAGFVLETHLIRAHCSTVEELLRCVSFEARFVPFLICAAVSGYAWDASQWILATASLPNFCHHCCLKCWRNSADFARLLQQNLNYFSITRFIITMGYASIYDWVWLKKYDRLYKRIHRDGRKQYFIPVEIHHISCYIVNT